MALFQSYLKRTRVAETDDELDRLRRAVRQDPRSLYFTQLADSLLRRGLVEEAAAVCRNGVGTHPHYVGGWTALGMALYQAGLVSEAIDAFERVVTLAPENLLGHVALGEMLDDAGRNVDALIHLDRAWHMGARSEELELKLSRLREGTPVVPGAWNASDVTPEHACVLLKRTIDGLKAYLRVFEQDVAGTEGRV